MKKENDVLRHYHDIGEKLLLYREQGRHHADEWEITGIVGEGSSSVCYSAVNGMKSGRLKEYAPMPGMGDGGGVGGFLAAYKTLEDVKKRDSSYEILNNYLPYYELLYSEDESGRRAGVFVWTPDDKRGAYFSDYLDSVRKNSEENADVKLLNIVDVIYTLTDCICMMHSAGLLHLDLKPSNFLVTYNSQKELNTGNISLFDINTISSVEAELPMIAGTEGYCAPEVDVGLADNRSDIYSIGAILFKATVISEMVPGGTYCEEYYQSIDTLVAASELIRSLESNRSREIRLKLGDILRRCLAFYPAERYDCCEQLLADLDELRKLIASGDYSPKAGRGEIPYATRIQNYVDATWNTENAVDSSRDLTELKKTVKNKPKVWRWIAAAGVACICLSLLWMVIGNRIHNGNDADVMANTSDSTETADKTVTADAEADSNHDDILTWNDVMEHMYIDTVNGVYRLDKVVEIKEGESVSVPAGKTLLVAGDGRLIIDGGKPATVVKVYGTLAFESTANLSIDKDSDINTAGIELYEDSGLRIGDLEFKQKSENPKMRKERHSTLCMLWHNPALVVDDNLDFNGTKEQLDELGFLYDGAGYATVKTTDKLLWVETAGDTYLLSERLTYEHLYAKAVDWRDSGLYKLPTGDTPEARLREVLENKQGSPEYLLIDRDFLRNDTLWIDEFIDIPGNTTIVIGKDVSLRGNDWHGMSFFKGARIAFDEDGPIRDVLSDDTPFVTLYKNASIVIGDLLITETGAAHAEDREIAYLSFEDSENGESRVKFNILDSLYVSGSPEEFEDKGLMYNLMHTSETSRVTEIYFESMEEPYESHTRTACDDLQLRLDCTAYDGDPKTDEVYLDYEVIIEDGETLYIPSGNTLIIGENGRIIVRQGGAIEVVNDDEELGPANLVGEERITYE